MVQEGISPNPQPSRTASPTSPTRSRTPNRTNKSEIIRSALRRLILLRAAIASLVRLCTRSSSTAVWSSSKGLTCKPFAVSGDMARRQYCSNKSLNAATKLSERVNNAGASAKATFGFVETSAILLSVTRKRILTFGSTLRFLPSWSIRSLCAIFAGSSESIN